MQECKYGYDVGPGNFKVCDDCNGCAPSSVPIKPAKRKANLDDYKLVQRVGKSRAIYSLKDARPINSLGRMPEYNYIVVDRENNIIAHGPEFYHVNSIISENYKEEHPAYPCNTCPDDHKNKNGGDCGAYESGCDKIDLYESQKASFLQKGYYVIAQKTV